MIKSKLPDIGNTIFTHVSALAAQHQALNLSQGFPDFDAPEALREAMCKHVMAGHNQYAPMPGVLTLREAIAEQVMRYRQVTVDPEVEITITPGATQAIFCAIMAVVNPGDEVIVFDPCYDSYEPAIRLAGGRAVHVPLCPDQFSLDWEKLHAALSQRTRMIIINSPHNPTGSTLKHSDMLQLEEIVQQHDLLVISDEVYEHLVFDQQQHWSVMQFPALRARSFAVFSFGKTFSVTGWKTGYCIAPPQLTAELRKIHQYVSYVAVTPVQLALVDFMQDSPDYAAGLAEFYQHKRDLFCAALDKSRFTAKPSAGTYFQLLDYSDISDTPDTQLCDTWTAEIGLASIPISVFYQHPPEQFYLRFCFAKNDEVLLQAAEILCKI